MSKRFGLFLLVAAMGLMLMVMPSAPAGAVFNADYLTAGGLPTIRLEPNSSGGVTLYSQGSGGDARFMEIVPGGGHWEVHSMTSLPTGNALELDTNGYVIVHQE